MAAGSGSSRPGTPAVNVATYAYNAGFRGPALALWTALGLAETGGSGDPKSINPKDPAGGSFGIWQINGIHAPGGNADSSQGAAWAQSMLDPATNAAAAYQISDSGKNPRPWSTYTNGAYARYLPQAIAAAAQVSGQAPVSRAQIASSYPGGPPPPSTGGQGAGGAPTPTTAQGSVPAGLSVGPLQVLGGGQLEAIKGGALIVAGGALMLVGVVLVIALGRNPASATARGALQSAARAPQARRVRTERRESTIARTETARTSQTRARIQREELPKREATRTTRERAVTRQQTARARELEARSRARQGASTSTSTGRRAQTRARGFDRAQQRGRENAAAAGSFPDE